MTSTTIGQKSDPEASDGVATVPPRRDADSGVPGRLAASVRDPIHASAIRKDVDSALPRYRNWMKRWHHWMAGLFVGITLLSLVAISALLFLSSSETSGSSLLAIAATLLVVVLASSILAYHCSFYVDQYGVGRTKDLADSIFEVDNDPSSRELHNFAYQYERTARVSLYGLWFTVAACIVAVLWITASMTEERPFSGGAEDTRLIIAIAGSYLVRLTIVIVGFFIVRMQLSFYKRAIQIAAHLNFLGIALRIRRRHFSDAPGMENFTSLVSGLNVSAPFEDTPATLGEALDIASLVRVAVQGPRQSE